MILIALCSARGSRSVLIQHARSQRFAEFCVRRLWRGIRLPCRYVGNIGGNSVALADFLRDFPKLRLRGCGECFGEFRGERRYGRMDGQTQPVC